MDQDRCRYHSCVIIFSSTKREQREICLITTTPLDDSGWMMMTVLVPCTATYCFMQIKKKWKADREMRDPTLIKITVDKASMKVIDFTTFNSEQKPP